MIILSRSVCWIVASCVCAVLVSTAAVILFSVDRRPEWRKRLDEEIPVFTWRPGTKLLEADRATNETILNDIIRRAEWGAKEIDYLFSVLSQGYPAGSDQLEAPPHDVSTFLTWQLARTVLTGRLELNEPVTDDARARIVEFLVQEVGSSQQYRRKSAGIDLISLGIIEDPAIRILVEGLLDDPVPRVAEDIAFLLARYDERKAKEEAIAAKRAARERP